LNGQLAKLTGLILQPIPVVALMRLVAMFVVRNRMPAYLEKLSGTLGAELVENYLAKR
jgi:hypothetical protein